MKPEFKFKNRRIKVWGALVLAGVGLLLSAGAARAQLNLWSDPYSAAGVGFHAFQDIGLGSRDPRVIIAAAIQVVLGFLGVVAIVLIMYGGTLWLGSKGDADKIKKARGILVNAAVGLLIILSAFALAIYVTGAWMGATGAGGSRPSLNGNSLTAAVLSGSSAIGSNIVQSVYPAPGQAKVPRNTMIMVIFKELIDPATICDAVAGGKCASGAKLLTDNIKILANNSTGSAAGAQVKSNDNKIFVFTPEQYLGSAAADTDYTVALSSAIKKLAGAAALPASGFQWSFQVSTALDLTPPQIVSSGLFPPPDNAADSFGQSAAAQAAYGQIIVKAPPRLAEVKGVRITKTNPNSADLNIINANANTCEGQINISLNATAPITAAINYNGLPGLVDVSGAAIVDNKISTACNFSVALPSEAQAGDSWRLDLSVDRSADTITVGQKIYTFVGSLAQDGQILAGATANDTAANIKAALAGNADVTAGLSANRVTVKAKTIGAAGNNITLLTSASGDAISLNQFSGGLDAQQKINVNDIPDQPKNAVIQINFNKAMDPTTLSGSSDSLKNYLQVATVADGGLVAGQWRLSNNYQTAEFIPDAQCGVNGCGQPIFCLPGGQNLQVNLSAAKLSATCVSTADCGARAPFNACQAGVCVDKSGAAYPVGVPLTGLADVSGNSLDGNRDGQASGPASFFDQNKPIAAGGDNFRWSFWVTNNIDNTPPAIVAIAPTNNQAGVDPSAPVTIRFSKLMLASTLASGNAVYQKDNQAVVAPLINLRSMSGQALGFWVQKYDDNPNDAKANPTQTTAVIYHTAFGQSTASRASAGSGVQDIYQNCFKPCAGAGCSAGGQATSCCLGQPVASANPPSCK